MSEVQISVIEGEPTAVMRDIRKRVFIDEQKVAPELEWDEHDANATHFLLSIDDSAVGTGRLLPSGRIGRIALLPAARGKGLGRQLMCAIMQHAQQVGMAQLELSAQTHALGFYAQLGFVTCSDVYLDAGIAHQTMRFSQPASNPVH